MTDDLSRSSSRAFTVQVVAPVVVRLPHEIQGAGTTSPFVGDPIVMEGAVTARKTNGFFVQTRPGFEDGDPLSSEGVFVFTSSAPPASAAVGQLVRVSGTVAEFQADAFGPTLTEIPIHITIEATDDSGEPACAVESVQSSEPVTGPRFGNTSPDWSVDGPLDVRLRAERSGSGPGRLYAIKGTCTDAAGNTASAYTFVVVPRL